MKKLIRDKIPDIAKSQGRTLEVEVASDSMLAVLVRHKLREELDEVLGTYYHDSTIEELGDLLDVIEKFMEVYGITKEQVETSRKKKNERNGGFSKNLVLTLKDRPQ
jgi:predicted house-cleaning noncanonical NTP pyrophosphatase (MazG superfamily)